MKSIKQLHSEHIQWLSEIDFMEKEIIIFEHMIEKYKKEINDSSFNMIANAFYDSFEHIKSKLHKMKVEIDFHEVKLREAIQENSADSDSFSFKDPVHMRKHLDDCVEKMRAFKESLYDYIVLNKK